MGYEVDKVVICDAFSEPGKHYELLPGGKSRLTEGRRLSRTYLSSGADAKKGLRAVLGGDSDQGMFEFATESNYQENTFINELRAEVRDWRDGGYCGTAQVTRNLLEWWFERDDERFREYKRLFFCQQEAIETLIYLYEVKKAPRMPETEFCRYALKLATGTGKTVVMATIVVWSTLHRAKVSGSPLTQNFLVLVPNLTVRSRVSGHPRGDGLDPSGAENLYAAFDLVPPDYADDFHPNVMVKNWQSVSLEPSRDDWVGAKTVEAGAFIPYAVLRAMKKRAKADPKNAIRRVIGGKRDVMVFNDEAHHVYGEKRTKKGEDPAYIKWSKIIELLRTSVKVPLVVDLSATPWYGSGSPKPEGQLFEWVVCDFSVYDAFESGLVKVVRLPEPDGPGRDLIDLWDRVKGSKNQEDYLSACKGAIAAIYSSWKDEFRDWSGLFDFARGPQPVLLVVADKAKSANWLYEHLTSDYDLLENKSEEQLEAVTLRIDSKVFDSDAGKMAVLREMVDTVGKKDKPGEDVRAIVSVNMLSEGWDVKSVTHILGLRAFGSPLLTEQIVGRGLRRTSYELLYKPLDARDEWQDETVDAFGVPFVGFPVQRRKRKGGGGGGRPAELIDFPKNRREPYRIRIPNVRSWALGVSERLLDVVDVMDLPEVLVNPKDTPPEITVKPVVGGNPEGVMSLAEFRSENPLIRTIFRAAKELMDRTSPEDEDELKTGPTFEELLELVQAYVDKRVRAVGESERVDVGIYYWRQQVLSVLENAIKDSGAGIAQSIPLLGQPAYLDTANLRPFQWRGEVLKGVRKTCSNKVPCNGGLELKFAEFLESSRDVECYIKNERLRYSITYYENGRARQYFPDFVVKLRTKSGGSVFWVVETKGEVFPNTHLKREAARLWCQRLSSPKYGTWRYLYVQQIAFEKAIAAGVKSFDELRDALVKPPAPKQIEIEDMGWDSPQAFTSHLPLYTLDAAAGSFGQAQVVEPRGWIPVSGLGKLDKKMFVARAVGRSMEPKLYDGDYCVFRKSRRVSEGKVVLAQWHGPGDPETGGSYAVKIYGTTTGFGPSGEEEVTEVTLSPLNPEFAPLVIRESEGHHLDVVASFIGVLKPK